MKQTNRSNELRVNHPFEGKTFLRRRDVELATSLTKTSIYRMISAGSFPRPFELSPGRVAWLATDVEQWIAKRVAHARVA